MTWGVAPSICFLPWTTKLQRNWTKSSLNWMLHLLPWWIGNLFQLAKWLRFEYEHFITISQCLTRKCRKEFIVSFFYGFILGNQMERVFFSDPRADSFLIQSMSFTRKKKLLRLISWVCIRNVFLTISFGHINQDPNAPGNQRPMNSILLESCFVHVPVKKSTTASVFLGITSGDKKGSKDGDKLKSPKDKVHRLL